jgi:hypothetical protein
VGARAPGSARRCGLCRDGGLSRATMRRKRHYRNPALCRVLDALPSVFLSGTRQRSALRTLGKEIFTECQTLDKRRRSAKDRQQPSIAYDRYLCQASGDGTRQISFFAECQTADTQQSMLCRVPLLDTRQSIF